MLKLSAKPYSASQRLCNCPNNSREYGMLVPLVLTSHEPFTVNLVTSVVVFRLPKIIPLQPVRRRVHPASKSKRDGKGGSTEKMIMPTPDS